MDLFFDCLEYFATETFKSAFKFGVKLIKNKNKKSSYFYYQKGEQNCKM